MILVGSQRGGAVNLAQHLMNDRDNDHVALHQVRGFLSRDLEGALTEAHAISKGTRCQQFLFSLSLSPPKQADVTEQDLSDAVERAERVLGLDGQPRAIVFHEKEGRRHAHAVWSRIDAKTMTAINLPHFKTKLNALARDLFLDHGWELPNGLRRDGGKSPLNFTLAEWQQAKRLKLDPREIKQSFQDAWRQSDSSKAFKHALEDKGYFLAKGDRRGFVALDINGEVFSIPKMLGVKTKEVRELLGDPMYLSSVDETREMIAGKVTTHLKTFIEQVDYKHDEEFAPLRKQRAEMVRAHRSERRQLKAKQEKRWKQESRDRALRLNTGLKGLWDRVSGRASKIKTENMQEAWAALKRDQHQRDDLVNAQMGERRDLQKQIEALRHKHAKNRQLLSREIAQTLRMADQTERMQEQSRQRVRERSHLSLTL